jgi:hypothetical protein
MIKIRYKSNLDKNLGHHSKNVLSYSAKIKNNELPITEISWRFIWHLIKHKLKHPVYFFVLENKNHQHQTFNWFYLKKRKLRISADANKKLVKKYLKKGVHRSKIIITKQPSVVSWSISRKCIVDDIFGSKLLPNEKIKLISMLIRTKLTKQDVDEINNSNGIVCTNALYGREGFRYGFLPS